VREIRKHGSEGGAGQLNVPFLPLSKIEGGAGSTRIRHSTPVSLSCLEIFLWSGDR